MAKLEELTDPELVFPGLTGTDASSVLRELAERLVAQGRLGDAAALHAKLMEREELCSTGIGGGVAIPHCKLNGIDRVLVAIGISPNGVAFGAVDDEPVRLFFMVISPSREPAAHLRSLASISKWVRADDHVERIMAMTTPDEVFDLIRQEGG